MPQVQLGGGLGEGEEIRAQANLSLFAEHGAGHVLQGALQIGHGQALIHGQALNLMEDRGVGGVQLVGAVHLAGAHDVQGQLAREHRAHLHRGGVGAQQQVSVLRLNVEGVLHFAGRVVRLNVQSVKVVPLGLQLGAVGNLPAHADENVSQALLHQGDGVAATQGTASRCGRHVHGLLGQDAGLTLSLQLLGASLNNLGQCGAGLTQQFAHGALVLVLKVAHLAVSDAHDALLAKEAQAHLLEAVKVFCLLANLLLGALSLGLKCLTNGVQTLFGVVLQDLRNVGEDLSRTLRALMFLHGIGHCHSSLRTTGALRPVGWLSLWGCTAEPRELTKLPQARRVPSGSGAEHPGRVCGRISYLF